MRHKHSRWHFGTIEGLSGGYCGAYRIRLLLVPGIPAPINGRQPGGGLLNINPNPRLWWASY